jgi:4-deoxy-L-threo-5-hexosulose-uronate ketol-isomerase
VGAAGASHALNRDDGLYLGRGVEGVEFRSDDAARPARFYLVSYPAHTAHPTRVIRAAEAATLQLGQPAEANHRTIHKYIHSGGVTSCQLTMGITRLQPGSVWNTMPPHTHSRRTEVYLYFDLPPENMVIHLMGEPQATRHLLVRNEEVILSPAWSIHCGAGTRAYQFAWAMGGENQDFADMDRIPVSALR